MSSTSLWCRLLCLGSIALSASFAAEQPEPKEIPVPPITTALGVLPGPDELPMQSDLPAALRRNDGTLVRSAAEWPARRTEILRTLEYYAVGQAPPAPGNVKGHVISTRELAGGKARYRLVHLTFGPKEQLSLDIGIYTPAGPGPFPAVIAPAGTPPGATPLPRLPNGPTQGRGVNVLLVVGGGETSGGTTGTPGAIPAEANAKAGRGSGRGGPADPERVAESNPALARGYAYVVFNHNDCGEDTTLRNLDGSWAFRTTRFFPAYPGYDWGLLRSWAWGVSRIVDFLEQDPLIDARRLIVTGASRTGKSAMVAAAFDPRIAMGAPVVTGGGGIGTYRHAGPRRSETLDMMVTKYPNWFSPQLHAFRGQRERLPFDEHWFLAACAPRPFLALEGDADVISLPEAVRQSWLGAQPAYALFGATDHLAVHYAPHAHAFTNDDWAALLDFADWHLRGHKSTRRYNQFPTDGELDDASKRKG